MDDKNPVAAAATDFIHRTLANVAVLLEDYEAFAKGVIACDGGPCPMPDRHRAIAAAVEQARDVLRPVEYAPTPETITIGAGETMKITGLKPDSSYSFDLAVDGEAPESYRVTQRQHGVEDGTRSSFLTTNYCIALQEFCRLGETAPKGVETVMYRGDAVILKTVRG